MNTALTAPQDIYAALITDFMALVWTPPLPTAYPYKEFVAPASGNWLGVNMLDGDRFVASLGDNGEDGWEGIMQIDVHTPENSGPKFMNEAMGKLLFHFYAGKRLEYNGQMVKIRRSSPSSVRREGASYVKSVSVYWSSWTQR
jgi:hypothetical protein